VAAVCGGAVESGRGRPFGALPGQPPPDEEPAPTGRLLIKLHSRQALVASDATLTAVLAQSTCSALRYSALGHLDSLLVAALAYLSRRVSSVLPIYRENVPASGAQHGEEPVFSADGSIKVELDGTYHATTDGGPRVGITVDGQPDPAPFESTLPDAYLQHHRRELRLTAGQVVATSPPDRGLWLERVGGSA
jgi:hypothetical protein